MKNFNTKELIVTAILINIFSCTAQYFLPRSGIESFVPHVLSFVCGFYLGKNYKGE